MLGKLVLAVDQRVTVGKEAPAVKPAFIGLANKQVLFHFLEMLDDFFGNSVVGLAIGCRLETLKSTYLQDTLHFRQM